MPPTFPNMAYLMLTHYRKSLQLFVQTLLIPLMLKCRRKSKRITELFGANIHEHWAHQRQAEG